MEPQQPVDRPVSESGSALAARGPSANDPTTRGSPKGHITVRNSSGSDHPCSWTGTYRNTGL